MIAPAEPMDGRVRVLIITRSFGAGGAERQLLEFLRGIDPSRLSVVVGCFYRGAWHREAESLPHAEIVDLKKTGRYDGPMFFLRVWQLAKRVRPDVILGYAGVADLVALVIAKLLGRRVIWSIHNSDMDLKPYGVLARILFTVSCRTARFADAIVANSAAGVAYYSSKGFPRSKMTVIHNGVDLSKFYRSDSEGRDLRQRYSIPANCKLVTLIGRLDPMKNHAAFLHAISHLSASPEQFRFMCAGGGPDAYMTHLTALAKTLAIDHLVTFTGHIENVRAVYCATDITVLPSLSEGLPNSIIESMACETPCISTDVGDCKLAIGNTGLTVPVGDPLALADAIRNLSSRDLKALGLLARLRVQQAFSYQKMIDQTSAILMPVTVSTT